MEELFPEAPAQPSVRRVSLVRLSAEIARSLADLGRIAVEGEVHKPSRGASGRVWFTLRDRASQLRVTCPASRASRCRAVAGERVCVTGSIGYVNDRGELQLVADEVTPVGAGAIAAAIADARAQLRADGLLDRPRRSLPRLPSVVGVVCGSDAAVRADIESVIAARFPGYPVDFVEVNVSGPGAAEGILGGLRRLDERADVEVIILARGGGDAAQLLPFSDGELCRAVATCSTPVVSAIGHEGDRPLCDEVADLRCGTPSLAAGAVIPSWTDLVAELERALAGATGAVAARVARAERRMTPLDPATAASAGLDRAHARLARSGARLDGLHPGRRLADARARLRALDWRSPARTRAARATDGLTAARLRLDALDPTRILERGYAVVRDASGRVVRDGRSLSVGDVIGVQLARGAVGGRVEEVHDA
ncbi:MAG: exodeoxyribonuclease VII large subunit [Actinobacteria bacterium]|nr:exodeoxyribonuclease VII large subunit [Actinomycetota bacterium]